MNMALLGYSIVSLPASFNFMINSLTWVTFSLGGMQYVVHGGMVSVIGGIQVSLPAIPLVAVVPLVVDATGAVAAYMVMSAEQPDFNWSSPPAEVFDTFEDAVGQLEPLNYVEYIGPTREKLIAMHGYTEKWIGQGIDGIWYSASRNPTTGKWSYGDTSSHIE